MWFTGDEIIIICFVTFDTTFFFCANFCVQNSIELRVIESTKKKKIEWTRAKRPRRSISSCHLVWVWRNWPIVDCILCKCLLRAGRLVRNLMNQAIETRTMIGTCATCTVGAIQLRGFAIILPQLFMYGSFEWRFNGCCRSKTACRYSIEDLLKLH